MGLCEGVCWVHVIGSIFMLLSSTDLEAFPSLPPIICMVLAAKMEIQDIDDAEKSAGSDIISRTETSCNWDPKLVKPADIESGVTNNSMLLFLKYDCSVLDQLLTGCKNCRPVACNV